jgi:hypothetical protein
MLTIDELPDAPAGARNMILLTLDSLRYDSWIAAKPKNLGRLGEVQKRYTHATWTPPSHYNMLMGMFPHPLPTDIPKSDYLKRELREHSERLQIDVADFQRKAIPALYLPTFLWSMGYHTRALVSMAVINPHTAINRDFESYELMKRHNDLAGMIDKLEFDPDRPTFYLLNTGETHYPYLAPGEQLSGLPHISGLHGAVAGLTDKIAPADDEAQARRLLSLDRLLTLEEMHEARDRQINVVSYVDDLIAKLYERVPDDTYLVITSDHGDLFGEGGMFGHGAVVHEKVLEVPFAEGLVPR